MILRNNKIINTNDNNISIKKTTFIKMNNCSIINKTNEGMKLRSGLIYKPQINTDKEDIIKNLKNNIKFYDISN